MLSLLIHLLVSAALLLLVARIVDGIRLEGWLPAFIAASVFGVLNLTLGALMKFVTFPFVLLTFGLLALAINALMLQLTSRLVTGFEVKSFGPAFLSALLLAIFNTIVKAVVDV